MVELRFWNVPPEYAGELAAHGYRGVSSRQLRESRRARIG